MGGAAAAGPSKQRRQSCRHPRLAGRLASPKHRTAHARTAPVRTSGMELSRLRVGERGVAASTRSRSASDSALGSDRTTASDRKFWAAFSPCSGRMHAVCQGGSTSRAGNSGGGTGHGTESRLRWAAERRPSMIWPGTHQGGREDLLGGAQAAWGQLIVKLRGGAGGGGSKVAVSARELGRRRRAAAVAGGGGRLAGCRRFAAH